MRLGGLPRRAFFLPCVPAPHVDADGWEAGW
ncbi:hypothetical protein SAMN05428950_1012098 [Sphingomonas sp. OV641]|nr:hypothetical protein SAMN05428950_1012098 [Sphingomonas sp. OV641]